MSADWPNAPASGAANWNGSAAQAPAVVDPPKNPTPGKLYARLPLRTLGDVQKAMATIIRECRSGRTDLADGSKLIFMLSSLARVIEGSELEKRIEALDDER